MKDIEPKIYALTPRPGDLLVFKTDQIFSTAQREAFAAQVKPHVEALGCKAMLVDGVMDIVLIKQAVAQGYQPSVTPTEDAQAAPPVAR